MLPLGEGRVTFGALVDNLYVQAPFEPAMRPFLRGDLAWSAALLDALPNIDWLECSGQMHDVPPEVQTQTAFAGAVRQSSKPILVYPYDRAGLLDILDAAAAIRGRAGGAAGQPVRLLRLGAQRAAPAGRLQPGHPAGVRRARGAGHLPPASRDGGNSPASIPGTLVLANADWLAGVTIHQLARPGAPFCSGGFTELLMDMRTTLWSYCAPEMMAAFARGGRSGALVWDACLGHRNAGRHAAA